MAGDAQALAKKLHDALGQKKDGKGVPTKISDQTLNYAKGIMASLKAAVVSHAAVVGVTAPGSPLSAGAAVGGVMVILPAPMIAETAKGVDPKAIPKIQLENAAIIQYIGTGLVNFAAGGITGTCTNTPTSPGPLTAGAGANGTILGLTGAGATAAVSAALGAAGPDMIKHYTALIDYINANIKATYATGTVTGVCPPGGGPLAGLAAGGTLA